MDAKVWGQNQLQTNLSVEEQKTLAKVSANLPEMFTLLQKTVDINSGTFHVQGVRAVGEEFAKALRAIGFKTQWVGLPDSLKRAGHLVATRQGKKGKKLFLIGHLDTVFEPDMPPNPYRSINDSTVTGQGVNDMKGGDVIIIGALKALHQNGLLDDATITVYLTGDEENAGQPREVSRADFIERAKQHDIALAFEGGSLGGVATARRGASEWILTVKGKQGHSSGVFTGPNYGAVYEVARIVNQFREALEKEKYLSINPGLIAGGSELNWKEQSQSASLSGKANIISPDAVALGDLRFISEAQKDKARETMRKIVAQNLSQTSAEIHFKDGIPAMSPKAGNDSLAALLNRVNLDLGLGPVVPGDPANRGAGDISYIAAYVDCLDGLGASGRGAHAPGETMNTKVFPLLMQRTALLIYRLTR
ncbi:MAG: M20 family peptidase [Sphingobacteriia bacterium]|nr:MAG: M20 family peptidase [Sphingobacteriia bacterium]